MFLLLADTNECLSNPCQNKGKCKDSVDRFTCKCPAGFVGDTCGLGVFY